METASAPGPIGGRYQIERSLGAGGSGEVFLALDASLHRHVAIKRFHTAQDFASSTDERAGKEALTLASLQHPNILTVFDFGVDEKGPYVVMEYLEGETLDKIVPRQTFSGHDFREAARQTMEGLIAAHHTGMIHRDLKPQNIMVTRLASGAPQYKILDFGLAKFVSKPMVQTMEGDHAIYGSIFYLTPEQLSRHPVDVRSDLYAMGCVYYYMLTSRNAFEGETIADIITSHLRHRVVPLSQRRPDLPPAIAEWVMRLISLRPDDRPATADEALSALMKTAPLRTVRIPTRPPGSEEPRKPAEPGSAAPAVKASPKPAAKRNPLPSIISTVVLVCVVGIVAMVKFCGKPPAKPVTKIVVTQAVARSQAPAPAVAAPEPRAAEPAAEPAAPTPAAEPAAPAAPVEPGVNPWACAILLPAESLADLQGRVGQVLAIKGRIDSTKIKGNQLFINFSKDPAAAAGAVFDLTPAERSVAASRVKGRKNQMVCVQGTLESADGRLQVRAKGIDQLDAMPPL